LKILGIIPARYASSRFPGKALAEIAGISMIERVYRQALKAKMLSNLVVATDHKTIFDHIQSFGGQVCMTSDAHVSGTDRCFEALNLQDDEYDYVINIQGDEPFISPDQIDLLASLLNGVEELATLIKKIDDPLQLTNPNVVKVIVGLDGHAIYFSRTPIPYLRSPHTDWLAQHSYFKHIGMYAYREDVLEKINKIPVSSLEKAESLEQLRWVENGFRVKVAQTKIETLGIDTPEDLDTAIKLLERSSPDQ
jgi:3-deoxy-manno-octulosonate cytidylyltransferase (CMP-KDO synthetase)